MQALVPAPLLRHVLFADAVVTGVAGLALVVDAGPLSAWFAIPAQVLRVAGAVLLPYALLVGWLATRQPMPRALVLAVIVCNALWTLDCVLALLTGWLAPTPLGSAFVLGQAGGVAALAALQGVGLRRSARLAGAGPRPA